jgi:hypothetical protein
MHRIYFIGGDVNGLGLNSCIKELVRLEIILCIVDIGNYDIVS